MGYKSDIEIAQETEMLPITEIAKKQVLRRNIWSSMVSIKQNWITTCSKRRTRKTAS